MMGQRKGLNSQDMMLTEQCTWWIRTHGISLCLTKSGAKGTSEIHPNDTCTECWGPIHVTEETEQCMFECILPTWGVSAGHLGLALNMCGPLLRLQHLPSSAFLPHPHPLWAPWVILWTLKEKQLTIRIRPCDFILLKALWPPTSSWENWNVPMLFLSAQPLNRLVSQRKVNPILLRNLFHVPFTWISPLLELLKFLSVQLHFLNFTA